HSHYKTVTLVAGLRLRGLTAAKTFDGPINAALFDRLGGDMPRPHTLARGDRRHGQSPRPQGAAGRATHQGGGRGVAISPSLQSRYEPHRKSLLQAQSLPAQTRRTDRRRSDPRPRNLRRNLQALGMHKLLQILRLSGRYRMIGFCSKALNLVVEITYEFAFLQVEFSPLSRGLRELNL